MRGDIFLKCVGGSDLTAFWGQPSGWDIRILPIVKSATGIPMRSLSSLVASSREDAVDWLCLVPGGVRSTIAWSERVNERENKQMAGSRLSIEEQSFFGGITRSAGSLMICPALLDWVRSEVEKDAKLHKALRLARDEKDAEQPGGGKRGGKNQRKKDEKEGK